MSCLKCDSVWIYIAYTWHNAAFNGRPTNELVHIFSLFSLFILIQVNSVQVCFLFFLLRVNFKLRQQQQVNLKTGWFKITTSFSLRFYWWTPTYNTQCSLLTCKIPACRGTSIIFLVQKTDEATCVNVGKRWHRLQHERNASGGVVCRSFPVSSWTLWHFLRGLCARFSPLTSSPLVHQQLHSSAPPPV